MCGESMGSESMCSACSAKFLDPATRDPALYPKNYDAIRQIHNRDPKHRGSPDPLCSGYSNRHALHKIIWVRSRPPENDRRSDTEVDTCSGTRAGVVIKLLLGSKMEVDTFVANFE